MRQLVVMVGMAGWAACGVEIDKVERRCDATERVGTVADGTAFGAYVLGERLLILRGAPDDLDVLVLDYATQQRLDEWHWDVGGRVVGTPTAPGLVAGTRYHSIDPATGALGSERVLTASGLLHDVRTLGLETHLAYDTEYVVITSSGEVVRRVVLAAALEPVAPPSAHVILEDGIVGAAVSETGGRLQLLRWNLDGTLRAERSFVGSELGTVDGTPLTRLGRDQALLVTGKDHDARLWTIDADLDLGEPLSVPGAFPAGAFVPQADGATYVVSHGDEHDFRVEGVHVSAGRTLTGLDVDCMYRSFPPESEAFAPRDAPRPTWVWYVEPDLWVHTE